MAASTKRRASSSAWSDLPSDLLGLVLPLLHSLADRVRAGAVCRQWRSAARQQEPPPPPPMPLLALGGGAYLDIVTDTVHELRALNDIIPDDASFGGSIDHLLFLMRDGGGCFLADPFSGAVLPVADLAFFLREQTRQELLSLTYNLRVGVRKVVGHWPSSSSAANPVVAALITNSLNKHHNTIFVCRAGADTGVSKESYSTMATQANFVKDLAFFRGNLYALTRHKELIVVELTEGSRGNPAISEVKYVITNSTAIPGYSDGDEEESWALFSIDKALLIPGELYLVPSGDQLLMVRRWFDYDSTTSCFEVYEADLAASPCRWTPVISLRGRALFLARGGSKSVPTAGDEYEDGPEPRQDCIYFVRGTCNDSGVYDTWRETVREVGTGNKAVPWRQWLPWIPTWVFSDRSASGSGRY